MTASDVGNSPPDHSPEEVQLARIYRSAARDVPPAAVDVRIRAAARDAVTTSHSPRRNFKRWTVPFAIAATVVLSVSVVWQMSRQGVIEPESAALKDKRFSEPAASPPEAATRQVQVAADQAEQEQRSVAEKKLAKASPNDARRERLASESTARAKTKPEAFAPEPMKSEESARLAAAGVSSTGMSGADVLKLQVSGSPGGYYFTVTIRSPDKGCPQYADWWEVLGVDGKLLYRRVLLHSHTDEQPFERSGGPVPIQAETTVWVRAHMNTTGYGGAVLKGSVKSGFSVATPPPGFAADAATQAPLPDGCAF